MNKLKLLLIASVLVSCAAPQFIQKGTVDGVEIAYRWNHPVGKPSELILNLKNTTTDDRDLSLVIDLFYQGRTMETMETDTCIRAGHSMLGKLNGIYFIPTSVTTEQIKDGGTHVETTKTTVEPGHCP